MTRVVVGEGHLPIRLWGRRTPPGALDQLRYVASQPWAVEHVAAMPDLHVANGIAVGTVFATERTIVPRALGSDLGCGVSAVPLEAPEQDLGRRELLQLLGQLARTIPVGDASNRGAGCAVPATLFERRLSTGALMHLRERFAPKHLGTLGGGNHFVELDRDAEGGLWLLVHSGSRGLGSAIAAHHLRVAAEGGAGELPGLHIDTAAGAACNADVEWALEFARANRVELVRRAAMVIADLTGATPRLEALVDVHHNFVQREVHFGRELLVHRKGAIHAPTGRTSLIPGSMGTASYLVEGLGEASSFQSASHGAGRVLTRKEARAQIATERFRHSMRRVIFDERRITTLVEEAPAAYRDIREVLDDEVDLIRPQVRLEPVAVLKG
jgi:tRNA-splicing ligase RtcB (3'-phosphate/5'-hydroxy nucleic acid ligase)